MVPESPNPDVLQQTTEKVARFIQWIAELIRRRNWFMLLVLVGVSLAIAGGFFRDRINTAFLGETVQGPFWASFWTGVVLLFVGALAVAVVTMPRSPQATAADVAERKAIKGLRPFAKEDADVFSRLQREVSLRECCEAMTSEGYKFGILLGESGCGKTSFLQAGLWPRLSQPESSHRAVYVRFSDQEPLATVGKAIAEQLEIPLDWMRDRPFEKMLTQAMEAAGKPVVLLLDQFEQFFVHNPRQEDRRAFVRALTGWYGNPSLDRVKLLVAIRADLAHELHELHQSLDYVPGPQDWFKLYRFSPGEAAKVLGVIAETERLAFDPRFVAELAEQELAHRDTGTISPVDVQILAWMIERQKDDELRAFNRAAFQKFGGVEGLLTRFLDRTLETRALPAQRQAAVKTLLALTDLDRQVRAGVLSVAELQRKMQSTAKPEEVAEAVAWLSRGDVRLVTPQEKDGVPGYELAHERLIPALMRVAGKELTEADKANQLLERRVNEWLGNGRAGRYLLGWLELWRVRRQRPFLVWGAKRRQKEALIRVSQRRVSWVLGGLAAVVLVGGFGYGYLNVTVPGQMRWVRWELAGGMAGSSVSPGVKVDVAAALIKDGQTNSGLGLIDNDIESRSTRARAVQDISQIAVQLPNLPLLQQTLSVVGNIDDPSSKSDALSAIASAYGELGDSQQAAIVLTDALAASGDIDAPGSKSSALSAIASAAVQQGNVDLAKELLLNIRPVAERADASSALRQVASDQALFGDWRAALRSLRTCLEADRIAGLAQILTHYTESKTPQLIDGPAVLNVDPIEETAGNYDLSVKIQSPDEDCDRHADWWEVLTEDGDLIDRYIIETPHEFERPFTTEKAIALDPDQTIIVRAHFSDDIDQARSSNFAGDYSVDIDKYPTQAMKGIVGKPNSFKSIRLPARFAIAVEDEGPQPQDCKPKE
ncbi:MAG: NACHT domain-containing protein [Elainellaceae cyanobacterium]